MVNEAAEDAARAALRYLDATFAHKTNTEIKGADHKDTRWSLEKVKEARSHLEKSVENWIRDLGPLRDVESWLSASEAARIVGVSAQQMTTLARAQKVRALKTSLGWLFDPDDVDEVALYRQEKAYGPPGRSDGE